MLESKKNNPQFSCIYGAVVQKPTGKSFQRMFGGDSRRATPASVFEPSVDKPVNRTVCMFPGWLYLLLFLLLFLKILLDHIGLYKLKMSKR